nr:MAG TPA: hypothetical protein [Caudoviricetes sp.]
MKPIRIPAVSGIWWRSGIRRMPLTRTAFRSRQTMLSARHGRRSRMRVTSITAVQTL